MTRMPTERLARHIRHSRLGYRRARGDAGVCLRTKEWLQAHPSARPEVDEIWFECLDGHGTLADWLAEERPIEVWTGSIPLRVLLASHPFRDLPQWSTRRTSHAS